jgi:hypothetical protein
MGAWLLNAFTGEQPRISPNLLPPNAAQQAVNTRLDGGDLAPLREPQHVSQIASYPGGYQSLCLYADTWLGWPGYVSAVPGPVATNRLYITGDGAPKMRVDASTEYPLAVPYPTVKLTGAVSGTGSGSTISRVYVYTFVTAYGEESEPNPASDIIDMQEGQTVTLSGFQGDPGGRNITKQRIYRTQTGNNGTDLYFIAERAVSSSDYADTIADDAFGEVIPSRAYNAPPDGLTGLTGMPNGMMAAFVGRDLYFCEPWLPHAWPEAYVLTCDYEIVALGAIGTSLIIMTKGNPYLVQGTDPTSMQMVKIESNLPCVNALGVVDLGFAIAYPSHEGLVLATAGGQVQLITEKLFNREAWQRFNPATIVAGQLSGQYIASYNSTNADGSPLVGTLIITSNGGVGYLSRSDVEAVAFFYDISAGALYFLTDTGEIKRFDAPSGPPLNQYWKSKPLLLPAPTNFAVMRIDSDDAPSLQEVANIEAARADVVTANEALLANPLGSELNGSPINTYTLAGDPLAPMPEAARTATVNLYADGVLKASVRKAGQVVRLPAGFKARVFEVDVFGTAHVQQIALATSVAGLKAMAGG